jgi:tRNA (cytidine/uridine-2'-O-)-methyltransferase
MGWQFEQAIKYVDGHIIRVVKQKLIKNHILDVVLVEPEIPPNTGNIARTCAATGVKLHLIEPLGFSIDDAHMRRAGLDYWSFVDVEVHGSLDGFIKKYQGSTMYLVTTKGLNIYSSVKYERDSMLIFGRETKGLPQNFIEANRERTIRIPMGSDTRLRSLNLSNSVAIVLYEALRQLNFPELA